MAETAEQIVQHYTAMGHSVDVIDEVIATGDTDEESMDAISRNVEHLELMKTRDYWTDEDMTAVDAAIVAGNAYNA
jgi:hypothetical protein